MARDSFAGQTATVEVSARGTVPHRFVEYAEDKVAHVCAYANQPVLAARVVLTMAPDPAVERRARAEASLDVSGTQVRAGAVASDMDGAIDLLEDKLRNNLVQHQDRERTRHRWIGVASEHEWRRGDLPAHRGAWFPRSPEERQVVRRKTFALEAMTPDEAAFEMDLVGHDFYLFTDVTTGRDALVYRDGDGRFAIHGEATPTQNYDREIDLVRSAPVLSEGEAIERLNVSGEPFVFYLDPDSGRGRVLYLRYDGHYGLITAAEGS